MAGFWSVHDDRLRLTLSHYDARGHIVARRIRRRALRGARPFVGWCLIERVRKAAGP